MNRSSGLGQNSNLGEASSSGSSTPNLSTNHSPSTDHTSGSRPKRRFQSSKLRGEHPKEWLNDPRFKRTRFNSIIIYMCVLLGFAGSGVFTYFKVKESGDIPLCLAFEYNFSELNLDVWHHEVQLGGFGIGLFDWTTTDKKNACVDSEGLHIVPTLTNEATKITNEQIFNGYTLNLTRDGACTGTEPGDCAIRSDSAKETLIPPVRSARLSTKGKKGIRYGRVEVVAKLPKGDWLWPAIWMMPEESKYGECLRGGEIDIMESRGNNYKYPGGGSDVYGSTLHWGPSTSTDSYWKTVGSKSFKRQDFSDGFHTFGMEWTEDYLYFYVDTRLWQVLYLKFSRNNDFWTRGQFEGRSENATHLLQNPWANSTSTTQNAPLTRNST